MSFRDGTGTSGLISFGKWSSGDVEEKLQAQVIACCHQRLQSITRHHQRIWNYMVQKCHVYKIVITIAH